MKKWICLMLAMLLTLSCAAALAAAVELNGSMFGSESIEKDDWQWYADERGLYITSGGEYTIKNWGKDDDPEHAMIFVMTTEPTTLNLENVHLNGGEGFAFAAGGVEKIDLTLNMKKTSIYGEYSGFLVTLCGDDDIHAKDPEMNPYSKLVINAKDSVISSPHTGIEFNNYAFGIFDIYIKGYKLKITGSEDECEWEKAQGGMASYIASPGQIKVTLEGDIEISKIDYTYNKELSSESDFELKVIDSKAYADSGMRRLLASSKGTPADINLKEANEDGYLRIYPHEEQEVPVDQIAELPKTGDDSRAALWFSLMCMAGAGVYMLRRRSVH